MSSVHYFQRYHTKENTHSANTCLLLSRLYHYDSRLFYNVISSIFGVDVDNFSIRFVLQDKRGKNGTIPDFSISQPGFKLAIEAKEKQNTSNYNQLKGHSDNLMNDPANSKFLILLAPSIGNIDKTNIENIRNTYLQIHSKAITYSELCNYIADALTDIRDDDMIEILDDYIDYCETENLVSNNEETIMIRLAGDTMDYDVKNSLFFDSANNTFSGFAYLGLYSNKAVKYVGKIRAIYKCKLVGNDVTISFVDGKVKNNNDMQTITDGFSYQKSIGNNMAMEYYYYLVDEFVRVDNFIKNSKRALYGKKKFYLSQFGLKKNASSKELAAAMAESKIWN